MGTGVLCREAVAVVASRVNGTWGVVGGRTAFTPSVAIRWASPSKGHTSAVRTSLNQGSTVDSSGQRSAIIWVLLGTILRPK
jgi:hypothetical protein